MRKAIEITSVALKLDGVHPSNVSHSATPSPGSRRTVFCGSLTPMAIVDSRKRPARIAGLWYLAMALSGPIGIVYVPSKILVAGDAGATAANIVAHELLLRVGILSSLVCQISFVFLVLALNRLFRGVNDRQAKLMVSLVIAAVPIAIVNELFQLAALELGKGGAHLTALAPEQRNALALAFLNVHQNGISLVEIFWGLWLFPFGVLVIQSRFIPRILGALLIVSGCSYLIETFVVLLAPQHREALADVLSLPMALGEVSMVLWLLIKGVRAGDAAVPSTRDA